MSIKDNIDMAVKVIRDALDDVTVTDVRDCLNAAIQNLEDALIYDLQNETCDHQHNVSGEEIHL